MMTMRFFSRPY